MCFTFQLESISEAEQQCHAALGCTLNLLFERKITVLESNAEAMLATIAEITADEPRDTSAIIPSI